MISLKDAYAELEKSIDEDRFPSSDALKKINVVLASENEATMPSDAYVLSTWKEYGIVYIDFYSEALERGEIVAFHSGRFKE